MSEITISFDGYNIGPSFGSASGIFYIDSTPPHTLYKDLSNDSGDAKGCSINPRGNSNLDLASKSNWNSAYASERAFVIQQEGQSLTVGLALGAHFSNNDRGSSPACVKVSLPPQHTIDNPEDLVKFVTVLAKGFEETFVRNGLQTKNGDFFDQCAKIIRNNTALLPELRFRSTTDDPENRFHQKRSFGNYDHINVINAQANQSPADYRASMERTVADAIGKFVNDKDCEYVVFTSPQFVRNLYSTKYTTFHNIDATPPKEAQAVAAAASVASVTEETTGAAATAAITAADVPKKDEPTASPDFSATASQVTGAVGAHVKAIEFHMGELRQIVESGSPDRGPAIATLKNLHTQLGASVAAFERK